MGRIIYGVLDSNNCLIDTSRSAKGAKQYATRNGYTKIGYRFGYNAFEYAEKINNKWVSLAIQVGVDSK